MKTWMESMERGHRVLHHLNKTKEKVHHLAPYKCDQLNANVDESWAGKKGIWRKSRFRIAWQMKRRSSETDFVESVEVCYTVNWLKNMIEEIEIKQGDTRIHGDKDGFILWSTDNSWKQVSNLHRVQRHWQSQRIKHCVNYQDWYYAIETKLVTCLRPISL